MALGRGVIFCETGNEQANSPVPVEKRNARLDADGHAHLVDVQQVVVRQIDAQITFEKSIFVRQAASLASANGNRRQVVGRRVPSRGRD